MAAVQTELTAVEASRADVEKKRQEQSASYPVLARERKNKLQQITTGCAANSRP